MATQIERFSAQCADTAHPASTGQHTQKTPRHPAAGFCSCNRRQPLLGGRLLAGVGVDTRLAAGAEALLELLDTTGGINELLLAGEVRVALAADGDLNLRLGGVELKVRAAGAMNLRGAVFRVNILLHYQA